MKNLRILDVTLRDGGYKNDFNFQLNIVENLVSGLDRAGIDYIEVGYRNGSFKPIGNIGPSGLCQRDYLGICRSFIKNAKLTVMFHPKNIGLDEISELRQCGVDAIRICFPIQNQQAAFECVEKAKEEGLEVCVNITRVSQYTREAILQLCLRLIEYGVDVVYLADSNGSLNPENVRLLFNYLTGKCAIKFGFHAHDNLFLAQANTIAAIESGASFVDSSILGLGKGAGNLRTEGFISFLFSQKIERYDLCILFEVAKYLKTHIGINNQTLPIQDTILGIFDLSQDDASKLGDLVAIVDYYDLARRYRTSMQSSKICSI